MNRSNEEMKFDIRTKVVFGNALLIVLLYLILVLIR